MAYLYHAAIVVDHNLIPANQTNFPVLVSDTYDGTGSEPDIRTTANGGHVQNTANGGVSGTYTVPADLVFSPNNDGSGPYDFEIQEYDPTTGKIVAWVRIPTLSSTVNTVFYMVYGDSTVVTSQEDVSGTWNANYMAVYHLVEEADGTVDEYKDSSGNGNHGQGKAGAVPSRAVGKIGYCQYFDGTGESFNVPHSATLDNGANGPFTVEMWMKPEAIASTAYVVRKNQVWDAAPSNFRYQLGVYTITTTLRAMARNPANDAYIMSTGDILGDWHHISYRQYSGFIYIRMDGVGDGSGAYAPADSTDDMAIGSEQQFGFDYKGYIDELRISNVNRGLQYEQACHNMGSDPTAFAAMGAEEGGPPIPPPGILPDYELSLMRSHPQMHDLYLVVQQPERHTEAPYIAQQEWVDFDWYCRVNGDQTDEITGQIAVNNVSPDNVSLLDGMTVLIGSAYGEWDKLAVRLRTDQDVGPGTTTLYIATSSDVRGHVRDGDYIVVLDEFRLWQRFGRIESDAEGNITWFKDHEIEWADLGAGDVARRLAMMPPVPVMGPHAVKFVDPPNDGASFYFDWSDSYAMAVGAGITSWNSWGETDHDGGTWTYNIDDTPGWQTVNFISGMRGFRVVLEVDDGNGNPTTLPYRRGVRYVFTMRRPGQRQAHDPANAEPITEFSVNGPIQGSFDSGYWKASITVYGEAASHYEFQPEALVVMFTDDWYTSDDPYLDPRGLRNASIGPIYDRENIILIGRIDGSSLKIDSEAGTVTFDILSPGAEAAMYHDYPVAIQDATLSTDWINTPSLNPDRALWYYLCWHTTLPHVADLYLPGDTHPLFARDFLEGTIYEIADSFLENCVMGRMLSDKYGRIHCEYIAQYTPYGTTQTLWSLEDGDWAEELNVKQAMRAKAKSADAGGVIYTPATGVIVPKLSRAPGQFDKYRGRPSASNSLAIDSQVELNIVSGRYLEGLNYEYEIGISLAGYWPYLDIAPQYAIYVIKETDRGTINARFLPQTISFTPNPIAGCIFTAVEAVQEMDDGVPGVTIPIPDEMPDLEPPETGLPTTPVFPAGFADEWLGSFAPPSGAGYWYAVRAGNASDYWDEAHYPTWAPAPGLWEAVASDSSIYKTCLMYSATTNRFFGYGWDGIWEYSPLPPGSGTWSQKYTDLQIATLLGHADDYDWLYLFRMQFSNKATQEGWAWVGGWMDYEDGDGDWHVILFCLHTRNAWGGIVYATVIEDLEEGVDMDNELMTSMENGLALDMHSNTVYIAWTKTAESDIWDVPTYDGWWKLFRSQNFGATFSLAQTETYTDGVDGYGLSNAGQCDVWVPWGSGTYQGGTVFWTACCMQEENLGVEYAIIPMIYRSQNHGLSYEDIGDDGGDLQSGLNILGGPYNSLSRVYGGVSLWEGEDDDQLRSYMWRSGHGWTLIDRTSLAADFSDNQVWVVIEQDGYELVRFIAYDQPWYVDTDLGVNVIVGPGFDIFWLTYIPA